MRKLFFVIFLVVVFFRVITSLNSSLQGKTIRVTGVINSEPREYETSLLVNLRDYTFFAQRDANIQFGSKVVVEGTVVGQNRLEKVKVISVALPTSTLALLRARVLRVIKASMPEPESSLLAGITLGAPNLPKSFSDALRATGTSHVVVASGGNLVILAGFLEIFLARFMKRKIFLPLIALALVLYSALVGFGAPVTRALIMWLSIMFAQFVGRSINTLDVFIFTIFVMLMYKPLWILDVSFQLSVGATGGIMFFVKSIQNRVKRLSIFKDVFATSLAAQIGTLPVTIFAFGQVNLLAPIWNSLVLWVVPYITVLGLLGSFCSVVFLPLARLVFISSYPFAWYFTNIIQAI